MDLSPAECRVLGCLIEARAADPESYPLTLNALRLACNQTTDREPVVAYDDRTVEDTLLALKSKGLVRFIPAGRGERVVRYGHRAGERWRMGDAELAVLAVLLLRGPRTTAEVRARAQPLHAFADPTEVDAILDGLAARTPKPFAARLPARAGSRDTRWVQVLSGPPDLTHESHEDVRNDEAPGAAVVHATPSRPELAPSYADLVQRVAELERRLVASLERSMPDWSSAPYPPPPPPPPVPPQGTDADDRSLPSASGDGQVATAVHDLSERVAGIERRLARIEAELGALR